MSDTVERAPERPRVLFASRQARDAIIFCPLAPVIPTRLLGARTPHPAATRKAVTAIPPPRLGKRLATSMKSHLLVLEVPGCKWRGLWRSLGRDRVGTRIRPAIPGPPGGRIDEVRLTRKPGNGDTLCV